MKYETVVGLEVHTELKTKSKIFCGCTTEFGGDQNTHVCPVCLGLPGVMPVLNQKVVEYAIRVGLALNCEILQFNKFDRKNYYYPDLPKNWQTSQYDLPICLNGHIDIEVGGKTRRIRITRIHMEEDAGNWFTAAIPSAHPIPPTLTTTVPVYHCWKSYRNLIFAPVKKLVPMLKKSVPSSNIWTCPTFVWKKAACVATPIFPYA